MVVQNLNIKEIGWQLRIYYFPTTANHIGRILDDIFKKGCHGRNFRCASNILKSGACNIGFTYSDKNNRESVIVIGKVSDVAEFFNTLSHELNHFVEHVMSALRVESGGEDEAYFTGELYELLFRNAVSDILPFV